MQKSEFPWGSWRAALKNVKENERSDVQSDSAAGVGGRLAKRLEIPGGMPRKGYSGNSLRLHCLFNVRDSYGICLRPSSVGNVRSMGTLWSRDPFPRSVIFSFVVNPFFPRSRVYPVFLEYVGERNLQLTYFESYYFNDALRLVPWINKKQFILIS